MVIVLDGARVVLVFTVVSIILGFCLFDQADLLTYVLNKNFKLKYLFSFSSLIFLLSKISCWVDFLVVLKLETEWFEKS